MMERCRNCCDIYLTRTQKGSLLSAVLMVVLGILAVTIMKGAVCYSVGGVAAGLFVLSLTLSYCLRRKKVVQPDKPDTIFLSEHITQPIEVSKRKYWEVIEKLSQIDAKYYPGIFSFYYNPKILEMPMSPNLDAAVSSSLQAGLLQEVNGNYIWDEETRAIILNSFECEWMNGSGVWKVANKLESNVNQCV